MSLRPGRGPGRPEPPAVVDHLAAALATARSGPTDLAQVADAVADLAPQLAWRQRDGGDATFALGHANTDIAGSNVNALEPRDDVWIGMSLIAPGVTYPDHRHPPEEVYLVLSGGDWRQEAGPWTTPGRGGIVYNPHNIVHAMRAGSGPLLAIWCLPIEATVR